MSIIEKAAQRLSGSRKGSLVEKAAARIDQAGDAPAAAKAPSPTTTPGAERPRPCTASAAPRAPIDFKRLRAMGIITPEDAKGRLAEEFRLIKRQLLLKAFRRGPDAIANGHLIMVTSAKAGEGKTFTAVNLAMSIASERDLTVLLVDADMIKPTILPMLGIEARRGLVDLLENEKLDVADVIIRTSQDNLSVIPSGPHRPNATELLSSNRMARFIEDIAKRYPDRVIIFDSPPVLLSSEPGALALHAGQIVFVVEAERTGETDIKSALDIIGSCKNIGFLLNKDRTRRKSGRYGSYYPYGS